ncbi:MAG: hypothetical protein COX40_03885 [Candidatus Omnitrophica bacterium CG23_combo_of_CG06-09_8_20_14_all_40_11]|nr:MAG: hypothetical protein COX40_03885 [Candidatus Omnitrophica bacterium CG23_combo_of_CG06-09_8_20_14_all_40_11]
MRLSKFLSLTTFATCFCLLYVYQQTEIFRFAYIGEKKSAAFHDFLDKNAMLRYNINKKTSLVLIDNRVSGYANFEMPDSYRVVKLANPSEGLRIAKQPRTLKLKNIATSLFGIKRQAEARTIGRP